jgi:hypothetical protein
MAAVNAKATAAVTAVAVLMATATAMAALRWLSLSLEAVVDRANGGNDGRAAMAVDGGGGDGVFAAAVNNDSVMVAVAMTSLVDGSGSDGHRHR